jgi:MYXO-CTERM domain-containing protein
MLRLTVILAAGLCLVPRAVDACSCGFGPPPSGFLASDGQAPANIKGLFWFSQSAPASAEFFTLDRLEEDGAKPVGFHVEHLPAQKPFVHGARIEPKEGWEPGARFQFVYRQPVEKGARVPAPKQSVVVTVSRDPLNWADQATLSIRRTAAMRGEVTVPTGISCARSADTTGLTASVDPGSWKPFATHLAYDFRPVGIEKWSPTGSLCSVHMPGRTTQGFGRELLYRLCKDGKASDPAAFEIYVTLPSDPNAKPVLLETVEVPDMCGKGERAAEGPARKEAQLSKLLRMAPAGPTDAAEAAEPESAEPAAAQPAQKAGGCASATGDPSHPVALLLLAIVSAVGIRRRY